MKRNKLTGTGSIGLFETGDLVSPFAMELFLFPTSEASTTSISMSGFPFGDMLLSKNE